MVNIPNRVLKIINLLKKELKNNNFPVSKMYLYGSYAKGENRKYSDIDILISSPAFDDNFIDNKNKIRKVLLKVSSELDVYPCSDSMFNESIPIIEEIKKNGIIIEDANE